MTPANLSPLRRVVLAVQSVSDGGMESQCVGLAHELRALGVEVAIVLPVESALDPLAGRFVSAGALTMRCDTDARNGRLAELRGIAQLVRFLRRWRPDAVHLHTGGVTGGIAAVAAARLFTSATIVVTEHNVPFAEPGLRLRVATRVKDALAHAVVALSSRNAMQRRRWLGEPVHFVGIPPGVRFSDATHVPAGRRAQTRRSLGIAEHSVVIVSVCRLAADKGVDDLIRAVSRARSESVCDLILVGDGPMRDALESLAVSLDAASYVHFMGHDEDPARFLDASDIFALAVPQGSGSVALLEAMGRGLPAVITYCGPGEFVVAGVTGLCAAAGDAGSLAGALLVLVRDPDLRRAMGSAGALRARARFGLEEVARDLVEVYATAKGVIPERVRARRLDDW